MKSKRFTAFACGCIFLATACSSNHQPKAVAVAVPAPALQTTVDGTELVAVLSDACLIQDQDSAILSNREAAPLVAAIVSAVLPKVIDKGLDLLSARLKAKAAAQVTTLAAITSGHLYTMAKLQPALPADITAADAQALASKPEGTYTVLLNEKLQCLHLIAMGDGTATEAKSTWDTLAARWGDSVGVKHVYEDLSFLTEAPELEPYRGDGVPLMLAELRLQPDVDHGALRLVPTFLWYSQPLGHVARESRPSLAAVVTLEDINGKTFLAEALQLGRWQPLVAAGPKVMTRYATGWTALPPATDASIKRAAAFSQLSVDDWKSSARRSELSTYKLSSPFNISVSVVETTDPKKWLGEIASVLDGSKQAISTALTNQLDPTKREAGEQAAFTADLGHQQAYELALIDEEIACKAWSKAENEHNAEAPTKWRTVVAARYGANVAAIAAGHAVPFPDTLRKDCTQVH
jgi:hypothetical protein